MLYYTDLNNTSAKEGVVWVTKESLGWIKLLCHPGNTAVLSNFRTGG